MLCIILNYSHDNQNLFPVMHSLCWMGQEKAKIKGYIKELVDAFLIIQRSYGLFHDIIDDPSTFVETNSAQMLAYTIFRGVKAAGWIDHI